MNMFNLLNLFTSAAHSRSHLSHCISVRWKRRPKKPSWLGIAKTKLFKIPVREELPECEQAEIDRLRWIYNRQLSSLQKFMATDESNKVSSSTILQTVKENIEKSNVLIDEWNSKSALLRKERLEKEKVKQEEAALEKIIKETEKQNYIRAKVDEIVASEIEASSTFVTMENLDSVLDECLNNIQDYNYAIDLKGNIYKGESNAPVDKLSPPKMNEVISDFEIAGPKHNQSRKENLQ